MTNTDTALAHKERAIPEILDEATPEHREIIDLVIGAALEGDDISGDADLVARYEALPPTYQFLIDFIVGHAMEDADQYVRHDDMLKVSAFLEHFGVKGMKWGVRRESAPRGARLSKMASNTKEVRREARDKIKGGGGTLADAHQAALKSTGHRVANGLLGDKKYWGTQAKIAGLGAAGLIGSAFIPGLMSEKILTDIGLMGLAASGMPPPEMFNLASASSGSSASTALTTANIGEMIVAATGATAVGTAATVANASSQVTNLGRAIRGNARIDKSYASLGKSLKDKQTAGSKEVQKVLNKSGGLRKSRLKQSEELRVGTFLEHYKEMPLSQVKQGV